MLFSCREDIRVWPEAHLPVRSSRPCKGLSPVDLTPGQEGPARGPVVNRGEGVGDSAQFSVPPESLSPDLPEGLTHPVSVYSSPSSLSPCKALCVIDFPFQFDFKTY